MKRFRKVIENEYGFYFGIFVAIVMAFVTYGSIFDMAETFGFIEGFLWGVFLTIIWVAIGFIIYSLIKYVNVYYEEIR